MKKSTVIVIMALVVAFVFIEGCASFGGSSSSPTAVPTAGSQNPASSSQPNPTTVKSYVLPTLTDAQKSQAESLAKANDTVKQDILSKSQFKVTDIYADYPEAGSSDILARVTFEGRDSAHSDSAKWMPEYYHVFVDLTTNKVTLITHIDPKPLK